MLIAVFLQNKFIVLFIIIFGTVSSLIDRVSEKNRHRLIIFRITHSTRSSAIPQTDRQWKSRRLLQKRYKMPPKKLATGE